MIMQGMVALMVASLVGGPMPVQPTGMADQTGTPPPSAPAGGTTVVPAGTTVALTLMTPIQSKTTKTGDTVRAVVAFPVTVGSETAIPAGTYVEGLVNAVDKHGPSVKIHFTRMVFANGYSAPLDAMNTKAAVEWLRPAPSAGPQRVGELAWGGGPPLPVLRRSVALDQTYPQPPPLPPLPQVGPSKGAIIGAAVGGAAAIVVLAVLTTHHRSGNYVLFDSGWQFQMTLETPLTLDAARIAVAANMPAPQ